MRSQYTLWGGLKIAAFLGAAVAVADEFSCPPGADEVKIIELHPVKAVSLVLIDPDSV